MGHVSRAVASLLFLLITSVPTAAQVDSTLPPLPSGPVGAAAAAPAVAPHLVGDGGGDRIAAATEWARAYAEWKEWSARWGNRRQPGWFTGYVARREPPAPPAWLTDTCVFVFDAADPLMGACTLLREWSDGVIASRLRAASAGAIAQQEDDSRTTWWEHLHVDVLWPAMQWRASTYGVIGMHAAMTVRGRIQAFVAPGMMVLNLPSRTGTRTWKVAANYGIGYRLFDFVFPGGRLASLHVNAARAWVVSDVTDVISGRTVDFAGFSLTFKQTP